MNKILLTFGFIAVFAFAASAQGELNSKGEPVAKNVQNAPVELKNGETITRGAALEKGRRKFHSKKRWMPRRITRARRSLSKGSSSVHAKKKAAGWKWRLRKAVSPCV